MKYTSRAGLHTNMRAEGIGHFNLGEGGIENQKKKTFHSDVLAKQGVD